MKGKGCQDGLLYFFYNIFREGQSLLRAMLQGGGSVVVGLDLELGELPHQIRGGILHLHLAQKIIRERI